jgi:uroporphyrinogen-III synthase
VSTLGGKRVLVTRATEQAEGLCRALEERGALAIRCPTIRLGPPESWAELDAALGRLDAYDWVVFTSANGVRFTLERMDRLGLGPGALRMARVATVGPSTAAALAERGVGVAYVAPAEGSIPLAQSLRGVEGASMLLARSDRSDPVAAGILLGRGAGNVDEVVAYRTVPTAPEGAALEELRRGVDGITFTSPSTVQGFLALGPEWRRLAGDAVVASLGATTTAAAREAGLVVEEAAEKTMNGLLGALASGFARRAGGTQGSRAAGERSP